MTPPRTTPLGRTSETGRVDAVDVARAIASVLMIQGHAFHAWLAPEIRASPGYAWKIAISSLPLPSFLVLAGVSIVLRLGAASDKGEPIARVRRSLVRRGLEVLGAGYATNVGLALLDAAVRGDGSLRALAPEVALRVDVLHVIGLSIAVTGLVCVRATDRPADATRRLARRAALLGALVLAATPIVSRASITGPARYALGLWIDVGPISPMPLAPLYAWLALGVVVGELVLARPRRGGHVPGSREALALVVFGAGAVLVFGAVTHAALDAWPGPFDRRHPAIVANALDLGGRAVLVLAVALFVAPHVPRTMMSHVAILGRRSLYAYVAHLPFCYGALGAPLHDRLSVVEASVYLVPLVAFSYAVAYARDAVAARSPARRE